MKKIENKKVPTVGNVKNQLFSNVSLPRRYSELNMWSLVTGHCQGAKRTSDDGSCNDSRYCISLKSGFSCDTTPKCRCKNCQNPMGELLDKDSTNFYIFHNDTKITSNIFCP